MSHPALPLQTQRIIALWPILIFCPIEGRKLSWPRWLVTYRDGMPVRRRSPIPVLTDRKCGDRGRTQNHKSNTLTTHSGTSSSISYSPIPSPMTSSSSDSPFCTSLFHSRLKTYLFHKSYPHRSFTFPPGLPPRIFA